MSAQQPELKQENVQSPPVPIVKQTDHWLIRLLLGKYSSLDTWLRWGLGLLALVWVLDFLGVQSEKFSAQKNSTSIGCGSLHPSLVEPTKLPPPPRKPTGALADMPEAWEQYHEANIQRYAYALAEANEDKLQIGRECGYFQKGAGMAPNRG